MTNFVKDNYVEVFNVLTGVRKDLSNFNKITGFSAIIYVRKIQKYLFSRRNY